MIKITDKEVYSTEGKYVHRIGTDTYFKRCSTLPDDIVEMFEEVDALPPEPDSDMPVVDYHEEVNNLIRQTYSLSEELAILRQRDDKPEEYQAYFDYCEQCKQHIKNKMNL